MLLPRPESTAALATLDAQGYVDLGAVRLERHGAAVHLLTSNPRYLNAEDQATIVAMEIGVDVATCSLSRQPSPKRCAVDAEPACDGAAPIAAVKFFTDELDVAGKRLR